MELTRKVFFETAVNILFESSEQTSCTYKDAICKAEQKFGITHDQLKELCKDGVEGIKI